jgi:hypothetical protein
MNMRDDAIAADRDGRLLNAADLYEKVLEREGRSLEIFLNLAVLYWQVSDFGFWAEKGLPEKFVKHAGVRLYDLLDAEFNAYRKCEEARFWKKYILWADLGEEFSAEECEDMLRNDQCAVSPVMFLFAESKGKHYREQAMELLAQCQVECTTRARYVQSVIEGVLKRSR